MASGPGAPGAVPGAAAAPWQHAAMALPPPCRPPLLALLLAGGGAWASTGDTHWTWQSLGPDAPGREHLVVRPGAVDWLDEQGRPRWRLDRASGTLWLTDAPDATPRPMDAAAIAQLAAALARGAELDAEARRGRPAPRRPWADVEAADRWTPQPGAAEVAGLPCRGVALHRGDQLVGEACIAEAAALPGGAAVLALLQALLGLAESVAPRAAAGPGDGGFGAPLHPLVAAARTGGLPLWVREQPAAGGAQAAREWRLAGPPGPAP